MISSASTNISNSYMPVGRMCPAATLPCDPMANLCISTLGLRASGPRWPGTPSELLPAQATCCLYLSYHGHSCKIAHGVATPNWVLLC